MDYPITSKFTNSFRFKALVITLLAILVNTIAIANCIASFSTDYQGQSIIFVIISVILMGVYLYFAVQLLRKITATYDGIVIDYILTGRQVIIHYADIVHVSSYRRNINRGNIRAPRSYLWLEIELTTGKYISFNEYEYSNYDELKEAIREYRFKLR
ncbi:MAG: hypothetical protein JWP94_2300 [Mucilaginibacter sp.]|nr:hypothetical protein [Mucilaginibacter sp.]